LDRRAVARPHAPSASISSQPSPMTCAS
jgi:hypothetical protein